MALKCAMALNLFLSNKFTDALEFALTMVINFLLYKICFSYVFDDSDVILFS